MAEMNFGGVIETVVTSKEFSLEKAREVLKNETIAVIGYGIQGPGQACNLRDNGFNVIVGQRQGKTYEKAVADGWVPGKTLFSIEEAAEKGTIVCMLLSDAGQIQVWDRIKPYLKKSFSSIFMMGRMMPRITIRETITTARYTAKTDQGKPPNFKTT